MRRLRRLIFGVGFACGPPLSRLRAAVAASGEALLVVEEISPCGGALSKDGSIVIPQFQHKVYLRILIEL